MAAEVELAPEEAVAVPEEELLSTLGSRMPPKTLAGAWLVVPPAAD